MRKILTVATVLTVILSSSLFEEPEKMLTVATPSLQNFKTRETKLQKQYNIVSKAAEEIGTKPEYLWFVINLESRNDTQAYNIYTGAVGLIQFMPKTLWQWGITVDSVYTMSYKEQVKLIVKYFKTYKRYNLYRLEVLYLCIFYPSAVGKSNSYVLGGFTSQGRRIARFNPGYDLNGDGYITKGEVKKVIKKRYETQKILP